MEKNLFVIKTDTLMDNAINNIKNRLLIILCSSEQCVNYEEMLKSFIQVSKHFIAFLFFYIPMEEFTGEKKIADEKLPSIIFIYNTECIGVYNNVHHSVLLPLIQKSIKLIQSLDKITEK